MHFVAGAFCIKVVSLSRLLFHFVFVLLFSFFYAPRTIGKVLFSRTHRHTVDVSGSDVTVNAATAAVLHVTSCYTRARALLYNSNQFAWSAVNDDLSQCFILKYVFLSIFDSKQIDCRVCQRLDRRHHRRRKPFASAWHFNCRSNHSIATQLLHTWKYEYQFAACALDANFNYSDRFLYLLSLSHSSLVGGYQIRMHSDKTSSTAHRK